MPAEGTFWHWVLYIFLDGIGGGILGGVIAWLLLRRTMQHETGLRLADRVVTERETLRVLLEEMRSQATALAMANHSGTAPQGEIAGKVSELFSSLLGAQALADRIAPSLGSNLDVLSTALSRGGEAADRSKVIGNVCKKAVSHSWGWAVDPDGYEQQVSPLTVDQLMAPEPDATAPPPDEDS